MALVLHELHSTGNVHGQARGITQVGDFLALKSCRQAYLGELFCKGPRATVPARPFEVQAVAIDAVLGRGARVAVRQHLEVEGELVDGDGVLAGEVLHSAGEEGLSEEEARQPEDAGPSLVTPVLQGAEALAQVRHVAGQRLEARV